MLFPSTRIAAEARDFLASQDPPRASRIVEFVICPSVSSLPTSPIAASASNGAGIDIVEVQILLFAKDFWPIAKAFWQHTGDGICSRMADRALAFLGETPAGTELAQTLTVPERRPSKALPSTKNRHYSRHPSIPTPTSPPIAQTTPSDHVAEENLTADLTTYLEERYGRNLPLFNAPLAKQALKRRIAGGLLPSDADFGRVEDMARGAGEGRRAVVPEDVYLYPGGMSAIWHAHNICRKARRASGQLDGKSICYG
jgi:cystathionine gamma-synthase